MPKTAHPISSNPYCDCTQRSKWKNNGYVMREDGLWVHIDCRLPSKESFRKMLMDEYGIK